MLFDKKNIRDSFLQYSSKVRNFLLSENCKEFLTFLFFVLVSLCFWLLQTLDENYQTEFNIPVRIKNVPKEVVMTSEMQDQIKVRVEDRGTVLLNYMLGRSFLPITVDFTDYSDNGPKVTIPFSEIQKNISAQLNSSTKILSIRPDTLQFIYARGTAKKVPVAVSGKITAGIQYYISDVKPNPDSVIVYAPDEILDNIQTAYTVPLNCESLTDSVTQRVALKKVLGAKFEPSVNDVSINVDMYSEKTLDVPVVGMNFPAGKTLRTFPSKVQVTFQVGLKNFKSISSSDFFIGVTYEDLLKNKSDKINLVVKCSNDNVSHVRVNPSEVDYLIEESLTVND